MFVCGADDQHVDVGGMDSDHVAQHPLPEAALYPTGHESVYESSARLLFMAIRWAKNLPSFSSLPFRDQVNLSIFLAIFSFLVLYLFSFLPLSPTCMQTYADTH